MGLEWIALVCNTERSTRSCLICRLVDRDDDRCSRNNVDNRNTIANMLNMKTIMYM